MVPMNNWIALYLMLQEISELLPTITLNYVIFYVPNRKNKITKLIHIENLISLSSKGSSLSSGKIYDQLRELHTEVPNNTFLFDNDRRVKSKSLLENNFLKNHTKYVKLNNSINSTVIHDKINESDLNADMFLRSSNKSPNKTPKRNTIQDENFKLLNRTE